MFQNQNEIFYIFWQHFLVVLCLAISINMSLLLCSFKDIAPAPLPWKPDPVSRLTPSCAVSQFNILSYSVASNIATSNLFVRGMKYHTCRIQYCHSNLSVLPVGIGVGNPRLTHSHTVSVPPFPTDGRGSCQSWHHCVISSIPCPEEKVAYAKTLWAIKLNWSLLDVAADASLPLISPHLAVTSEDCRRRHCLKISSSELRKTLITWGENQENTLSKGDVKGRIAPWIRIFWPE